MSAKSFAPPLDALYIATTAPRDASIQEVVRRISKNSTDVRKFRVGILFWEDICLDLATNDAVFFKHYPQFGGRSDAVKEHDQALFTRLPELLSSDGVIGFIDENNMAGFLFEGAQLDPLHKFCNDWNKPEREFITPEIEVLRKQLWSKARAYLHLVGTETFCSARSVEWRSVPAEWEVEHPDRFWRVVNQLHDMAGEIVALHGELVRTGRKHLIGGKSP